MRLTNVYLGANEVLSLDMRRWRATLGDDSDSAVYSHPFPHSGQAYTCLYAELCRGQLGTNTQPMALWKSIHYPLPCNKPPPHLLTSDSGPFICSWFWNLDWAWLGDSSAHLGPGYSGSFIQRENWLGARLSGVTGTLGLSLLFLTTPGLSFSTGSLCVISSARSLKT